MTADNDQTKTIEETAKPTSGDFGLTFEEAISDSDHYLKKELYALVSDTPVIFEFLKNGCLDGIWYWDLENPSEEWLSPRFKRVFGYADDEMRNSPEWWQANIHPDDLEQALDNFERHKEDPNHPYDQIVRYRHRDGSTVWVRCRGLMIRDESGEPTRMLGAHTDVTELKNTELELQKANESLERFAAVASHDLQAPLRQIATLVGILEEDAAEILDDESRNNLTRIKNSTLKMREVVRRFYEFSQSETAEVHRVEMTLDDLARDALDSLAAKIEESDAEISVQNGDGKIVGDKTLLAQVLSNLVDNAIKYRSDAKPDISISYNQSDDFSEIAVTDNGIGIAAHHQDRVFDLFARVSGTGAPGSGIGLAHCKKIVERHGGRIWLATDFRGPGTRMVFALPREH